MNAAQVINGKKVSDHHAIIPTKTLESADLAALPSGELAVLDDLDRLIERVLKENREETL